MYPYKTLGQKIQSHVDGVSVDRGFIAHFQVSAANAVAANDNGVLAATALTAEVQEINANITDRKSVV